MKYVHLGNSSVLVSEFCLGTMMFGGKTGPDESVCIIRRAVDAGVNFVDTTDVCNEGAAKRSWGRRCRRFATGSCSPARWDEGR